MTPILDSITHPQELKKLSVTELSALSEEIRARIMDVLSVTGGHLSSNLGIVELTLALHKVFNSPLDKMIFDDLLIVDGRENHGVPAQRSFC